MRTPTVAIAGNTYPVKDLLRAMGGRWDAARKAWLVPAEKADDARALVAGAPKGHIRSARHASWARGDNAGAWTGCSMGCREGAPNPRCKSCCFDEYDN